MGHGSKEIQEYGTQSTPQEKGWMATLKNALSSFHISSKEGEICTHEEERGFNPETDLQNLCEDLFGESISRHVSDMEQENPSGTSYRNRAFDFTNYVRMMDGESVTLYGTTHNKEEKSFDAQRFVDAVREGRSLNRGEESPSALDLKRDSTDHSFGVLLETVGDERAIQSLNTAKKEYQLEKAGGDNGFYSSLKIFSGTDFEKSIELPRNRSSDLSEMDMILDSDMAKHEIRTSPDKIRVGWNILCQNPEVIESSIQDKVQKDVMTGVARKLIEFRHADRVEFSNLDPEQEFEIKDRIEHFEFHDKLGELFVGQDREYFQQAQKWIGERLGLQVDEELSSAYDPEVYSIENE